MLCLVTMGLLQRAVDNRMCLANLEKMSASEKLTLLMKEVITPNGLVYGAGLKHYIAGRT